MRLPVGFVAPPRTISDITAILDSEKPDPKRLAEVQDDADDQPGKGMSQSDLSDFYYDRARALRHARVAISPRRLADADKAVAAATAAGDSYFVQRIRVFVSQQKKALGDMKGTLAVAQVLVRDSNAQGQHGYAFSANATIAQILVQMGDIPQAETYLRKNVTLLTEARTSGLPGWRTNYQLKGRNWEGQVEGTRALIFEARGQFQDRRAILRQDARLADRLDSRLCQAGACADRRTDTCTCRRRRCSMLLG